MEVISVIVPIYNCSEYLDKCIYSIANQTYTKLEILLVNDGSTDHSPLICENWANRDARIRVIHKKNGGQSSARNMALDLATGEYICFVDSDDSIHCDMLLKMYHKITQHNCDMVCCGYRSVDKDGHPQVRDIVKYIIPDYSKVYSGETYLKMMLNGEYIPIVWDKLYTAKCIGNHRFKENFLAEDSLYIYTLLNPNSKIAFLPDEFYNYLVRTGSTTDGFNDKFFSNKVELSFLIAPLIKSRFSTMDDAIIANQFRAILDYLIQMPTDYINQQNSSYLQVYKQLKENRITFLKSKSPLSFKVFLLMFLIWKQLAKFISQLLLNHARANAQKEARSQEFQQH